MSTKEASVKLTLKAGSFLAGMRECGAAVQGMAHKAASALSGPMTAGFGAAKKAASNLGSQITGTLKTAAQFGGIFAVGSAVKHAQDIQSKYSDLAFTISRATGKAVNWQSVQKQIEPVARATTRTSDELADAYSRIFKATGDADFAAGALMAVGKAATASGKPVEQLAEMAQILQRKFGATSKDLPQLLATSLEKADAGGASFEQITGSFDRLAGAGKRAGLEGSKGLSTMLGMLQYLDTELGSERAAIGMRQLFDKIKDGTGAMKSFQKTSGVKFKADESVIDKIGKVLSGGKKARDAFHSAFASPEVRNVFDELAKPFDQAVAKAKSGGATDAQARKAGQEAFDAAMKKMAGSSYTASKMMDDATKREAGAKRQMALAMETFTQEFNKPEVTQAFKDLAAQAPKVAQAFAWLVKNVMEHPILAGGAIAGGMVGGAGVKGAAASLVTTGTEAIGARIAAAATTHGGWKTAGSVMGVAAAGLIGFMVGKELADRVVAPEIDKGFKSIDDLNAFAHHAQTIAESPRATQEEKSKALAELQARIKATQEGGNASTTVMGWLAHVATGGEAKTDAQIRGASVKQGEDAARALQASLTKGGTGVEQSLLRGAAAIERAAGKLDKPGGGNGLPPAPGNAPGHGG